MSVDEIIRANLERFVQPVEDLDGVVSEVKRRQARRRRRRMRARFLVAALPVAMLGVGALVASMIGSDSSSGRVTAGQADPGPVGGNEQPSGDLPTVSVSASNLGPLRVTTSDLSDAQQAWLEHTVTLENTGTETVHVNDHRSGQFLGDREVLVADEGCGWAASPDEPVRIGCANDYRPLTLEPGAVTALHVTLWRDLQGMHEVTSDTFVFRKPIVYGDTPFLHPDQSGTEGELVLTYERIGQAGDPERRSDSAPPALEALAAQLLRTSDVELVVDGLTPSSYDAGRSYAVLDANQRSGLVHRARAGVAMQWSRPYSWAAGDLVPDFVVSAGSTILEFDGPGEAQEAAQAIRSVAGEEIPMDGLPAGFVAHGPSGGAESGEGVPSVVASSVRGQYLITVQFDFVGEAARSQDFKALVQAAAEHASARGR